MFNNRNVFGQVQIARSEIECLRCGMENLLLESGMSERAFLDSDSEAVLLYMEYKTQAECLELWLDRAMDENVVEADPREAESLDAWN